jgi:hypothetical protein
LSSRPAIVAFNRDGKPILCVGGPAEVLGEAAVEFTVIEREEGSNAGVDGGRVEGWRGVESHPRRTSRQAVLATTVDRSVSSPRLLERSMRISRTTLS